MEQDEWLRDSCSFGAATVAHTEHRPDYASAAVGCALAPATGSRVLDLGAGTGKPSAATPSDLASAIHDGHAVSSQAIAIGEDSGGRVKLLFLKRQLTVLVSTISQ